MTLRLEPLAERHLPDIAVAVADPVTMRFSRFAATMADHAVLRAWHPDHAALRRYLVDELLLARDAGIYWRIGGPA